MASENWQESLAALKQVGINSKMKRIKAVYRRIAGNSRWCFLLSKQEELPKVSPKLIGFGGRMRVKKVDGLNIVTLEGGRS